MASDLRKLCSWGKFMWTYIYFKSHFKSAWSRSIYIFIYCLFGILFLVSHFRIMKLFWPQRLSRVENVILICLFKFKSNFCIYLFYQSNFGLKLRGTGSLSTFTGPIWGANNAVDGGSFSKFGSGGRSCRCQPIQEELALPPLWSCVIIIHSRLNLRGLHLRNIVNT